MALSETSISFMVSALLKALGVKIDPNEAQAIVDKARVAIPQVAVGFPAFLENAKTHMGLYNERLASIEKQNAMVIQQNAAILKALGNKLPAVSYPDSDSLPLNPEVPGVVRHGVVE